MDSVTPPRYYTGPQVIIGGKAVPVNRPGMALKPQ